MRTVRPHVTAMSHQAEERLKLFEIGRTLHLEDGVNFLLPRFDASWSQPMSKEISFLCCPFAFKRIDRESNVFEGLTDGIDGGEMRFPILRENTNVVNAHFNIFDSLEDPLHDLLSDVW